MKAGDRAGQTLGERMSKGVGLAMRAGLGLISAGAAIATKGMVELDDITAQFTADTGATADEAARARKAILEMSGRNLQPMREIGAVLTKVHTDMDLTGEAAEVTAEKFLKFGEVTKRDASEEVAAFDDILDAWNLTADKSGEIMDALIASHQQYGGVIADDEAALRDLAPALTAANQTWEDGLALINLFKTAGADASTAVTGITKALGKVKSPEELQQLIEDISNTADPFERAQKAAELFGTKAGAKLANVLKPGIGALDDFKTSGDEVVGTTDRAADAIESTFGNRAQLLIKDFTSKLIDLGGSFGPVLTGIASLASLGGALGLGQFGKDFIAKMIEVGKAGGEAFIDASATAVGTLGKVFGNIIAKVIDPTEALLGYPIRAAGMKAGALFSRVFAAAAAATDALVQIFLGLPGVRSVATAVEGAGTALGTRFGRTFGAAAAAAAVFFAPQILDAITPHMAQDEADAFGEDWASSLTDATIDALRGERMKLAGALARAYAVPSGFDPLRGIKNLLGPDNLFGPTSEQELKAKLDSLDALIAQWERDHPPAKVEITPFIGPVLPDPAKDSAAQTGKTLGQIVGQKLGEWSRMTFAERLVSIGTVARQAAADAALNVAAGFRSRRSAIDSALDQLREDMKNRLSPRKEVALRIGQLFSHTLVRGLHSADPIIKKQAEGTRALIEDQLIQTIKAGGEAGKKIQEELERKLHSKDPAVKIQAQRTKSVIDAALKATPGKNPGDVIGDQLNADLANKGTQLGRTAYNLGRTIYKNLFAGATGQGPAGTVGGTRQTFRQNQPEFALGTDYVPYDMIAQLHRGEIVVPAAASEQIREGSALLGTAPTGGDTYQTTIVLPERKRDEFEIMERASWYQRRGLINPSRRLSPA